MICPNCRAEYRDGFTVCVDCEIPLVAQLPTPNLSPDTNAPVQADATDYQPHEDPYCAFWHGNDARLHAELCSVLDEAGIPHKTVHRTDRLFNTNRYNAFQIGVPYSLFEDAERAVQDAFGTNDNDGTIAVVTLSAPETGHSSNPSDAPRSALLNAINEDLTADIWTVDLPENMEKVREWMHKYDIPVHWLESGGKSHLLVEKSGADELRKIVKAILEGNPPSL